MGSLFYALLNGWYIGQWADYSSCLTSAADSQYVLATVKGDYNGPIKFTRGGIGKFTDGFSTRMGLCFPKQCTLKEVEDFTSELISGYATGVGWENVKVEYHDASKYDAAQTETLASGTVLFGVTMLLALCLAAVGTTIELTSIGDRQDVKDDIDSNILYEAAKFRRLT